VGESPVEEKLAAFLSWSFLVLRTICASVFLSFVSSSAAQVSWTVGYAGDLWLPSLPWLPSFAVLRFSVQLEVSASAVVCEELGKSALVVVRSIFFLSPSSSMLADPWLDAST